MTPKEPIRGLHPPGVAGHVHGISIDLDDTVIVVGRKGGQIFPQKLPIEKGFGSWGRGEEECPSCRAGYVAGSGIGSWEESLWSWEPRPYVLGSDPAQMKLHETPGPRGEGGEKPEPEERDRLEEIREALRESRALGISARRSIEALKQRSPRPS